MAVGTFVDEPAPDEEEAAASRNTGAGAHRPWWEDLYQDDEPPGTEPLVEAVEQIRSAIKEIKPQQAEMANLERRIGGVTRSINALEAKVVKADTTADVRTLAKTARTVAKRIDIIRNEVNKLSKATERKARIMREDDQIMMMIGELM